MPGGWKTRQSDGTCVDGKPEGECGGGAITIAASVGSGGANRAEDVRRVQEALNGKRNGNGHSEIGPGEQGEREGANAQESNHE